MRGAIPPLLLYVFIAWYLVKHRDKLLRRKKQQEVGEMFIMRSFIHCTLHKIFGWPNKEEEMGGACSRKHGAGEKFTVVKLEGTTSKT
jgi:hypothetical protein